MAAAFVSQTFAFALLSVRRHRALVVTYLSALALTAALAAELTATHGGRGAAVAVAIGETFAAITAAVVYARSGAGPAPSPAVLPRVALAAAIAASAALIPAHPLVKVAAATVAYFAVLLGLGAIPQELLAEIRRRT